MGCEVTTNLLQAEAEVGAEEEESAVEVHLVERDHQVVDAAVSEVVERLLLETTRHREREPRSDPEPQDGGGVGERDQEERRRGRSVRGAGSARGRAI